MAKEPKRVGGWCADNVIWTLSLALSYGITFRELACAFWVVIKASSYICDLKIFWEMKHPSLMHCSVSSCLCITPSYDTLYNSKHMLKQLEL